MAELADLLRDVADGAPPTPDADLTVLAPPDDRSVGVLAFTAHHVVSADVGTEWVRARLPYGDLSAPLAPPFLMVLAAATGRLIGNLDSVLVARGNGRHRGVDLTEVDVTGTDLTGHTRLGRALDHRTDVRAWSCPGGLIVLGRGVAGRWEVAVEVDEKMRGFGLGRGLFTAALGLVPDGEFVWAQVAPGNAVSLRAVLAAGYRPVGAEVLLVPDTVRDATRVAAPIDWFGSDAEPRGESVAEG